MRKLVPVVLVLVLAAPAGARALTLSPIGDFEQPTFVTSEPQDSGALLVSERLGKVVLVRGEQVTTLADLTSLVGCGVGGCQGERGLMSVVPSPDFAADGHIYVDYANNSTGQIHVDELTVSGETGTAPLSSRRPLLTLEHSDAANHNGGQLQFGPDGHLYVSTGDGGGGDDQFHHSQDQFSPLGKLLRVDPRLPGSPLSYEIWNMGLRNPFRFSFDSLNGDLAIGDVGQGQREEVDFAPSPGPDEVGGQGTNWGWNCREGLIEGPADDLPEDGCATAFTAGVFANPVFDYPHSGAEPGEAEGCAIIGGYVARDPSLGGLYGRYLYGDLCAGELRSLVLPALMTGHATEDRSEGLTVGNLNSFGEDSCHRLYTVSGNGEIARLEGAQPASCPPSIVVFPPPPPPKEGGGPGPGNGGGKPGPGDSATRHRKRTHVRLDELTANSSTGAPTATLTGRVTPCAGRGHQRVFLNRGGQRIATARLDRHCAVSFDSTIPRRATFRLIVPATAAYKAGRSRQLTITPR
jgi:hypothetical protein